MLSPQLAAAFTAGATVVTPNRRLARHLAGRYDAEQRAAGRVVWPAANALPWDSWLRALWQEAMTSGALSDVRPVVSPTQALHLWESVIGAERTDLLDARGAAVAAADAWNLFHGWRDPDESVDRWAYAGIADDAAVFAQWSLRFRDHLRRHGLADAGTLADAIAAAAPRARTWRGRDIVTTGFVEFSPQQRRLLGSLADAGMRIRAASAPGVAGTLSRVTCATPGDELALALEWARSHALDDPQATIAVVIEDLGSRRDEVLRLAEDLLCPDRLRAPTADAERPYGISLGVPLASVPLVATALDLIALASSALPAGEAAALLRSPYLSGAASRWPLRSGIERVWRNDALGRVDFADAVAALMRADRELGERWRSVRLPDRGRRSPVQWSRAWRELLVALGWPGDRPLDSTEWQALDAWSRALAELATLGAVAPALDGAAMLAALRGLATRTVFQPERAEPRIQIMGMLEASGMTFDALWIAGLTAERWPPAAHPDPLLPLAWQRERGVPRASAERELAYAQLLTAGFAASAREVVASHGRLADGFERAASALTHAWPERAVTSFAVPTGRAQAIAASSTGLAALDDSIAPAVVSGIATPGGAAVVESQSACPFQSFARHRLRAEAWPAPSAGLTPAERGSLLHGVLAALWTELRDHASLAATDAATLDALIAQAVTAACAKLERRRWRSLPAPVAAQESLRLAATVRAWLDACERDRPPFTVVETERRMPFELGGLCLTLQIDRVDNLADGGTLVLDYKSGIVTRPAQWFAERPAGTQVALYAMAWAAHDSTRPVRAIAYAQLKAGDIDVAGLAADAAAWPRLALPGSVRGASLADWAQARERLGREIVALAEAFRSGAAAVEPRDAAACRVCGLQPLCRIRALQDPGEAGGASDV